MGKDSFKRHIKGYRKDGTVCPCCAETTKPESRRLARRRLKAADRRDFRRVTMSVVT